MCIRFNIFQCSEICSFYFCRIWNFLVIWIEKWVIKDKIESKRKIKNIEWLKVFIEETGKKNRINKRFIFQNKGLCYDQAGKKTRIVLVYNSNCFKSSDLSSSEKKSSGLITFDLNYDQYSFMIRCKNVCVFSFPFFPLQFLLCSLLMLYFAFSSFVI